MSESKTLTEVLATLQREGVKVPPPPIAPYKSHKLGYQFKQPSTPSEKFVNNSLYSAFWGFGAGTIVAWFYDYKKVTRMPYTKALALHAKTIRGPFALVSSIGVTHSAVSCLLDVYNSGGYNRFEKEQTLGQKTLSAFAAGSVIGVFKASPSTAIGFGTLFAGVSLVFNYYTDNFLPDDKAKRSQLFNERFVKSNEPAPDHMRPENINGDKLFVGSAFFEESKARKKNTSTVQFDEQ
ncbi:hypothetical protein C9374_002746 [Naegleria lovaniensis]|uniref:Uncharacterized protein n=1 Tax=Naegleria lovaniensis TaxID=51637 RepID=A0AA88GP04_NAELO|nr:uncharacterized protein C9374_002746 [Naegleria lovaniensis]KAG2386300.1 hypothetical protein C9374_002746 [Naegleria lovaniensis]